MFPRYPNHCDVTCFNCATKLDQPLPASAEPFSHVAGNALGRGAYKAFCNKCRMFTWYDVVAAKETA